MNLPVIIAQSDTELRVRLSFCCSAQPSGGALGPQDGAHKLPEMEAIVRETMATMTTLREK